MVKIMRSVRVIYHLAGISWAPSRGNVHSFEARNIVEIIQHKYMTQLILKDRLGNHYNRYCIDSAESMRQAVKEALLNG